MRVSVALICASRRSSVMLPNQVRKRLSAGTAHAPERLMSPWNEVGSHHRAGGGFDAVGQLLERQAPLRRRHA